ncbi:hypothetical protein BJ508DRAFT_413029 [Ascobolus immersus RN42]|uniref:Uncharacterized protein n=1 Tax=Ascobolus immersus RN42 TaxID=1160509 RepID=A0A3N4IEI1_ASCIM|nr:hypothetical protein BJ508DRAFT_413029 [Ascobolus immersus RN42]
MAVEHPDSSENRDCPPSTLCTAIPFAGGPHCTKPAILPYDNPIFCQQHSSTCQKLYLAYKHRHQIYEQLLLEENRPKCLPKVGLETIDWAAFDKVDDLAEIRTYLRELYRLLDRCIIGRQIHHDHFFHDTSDYGHELFLAKLKEQRTLIEKALGRLEVRALELKHQHDAWFGWIKTIEEQEDRCKKARKEKMERERKLWQQHQEAVDKVKAEEDAVRAELVERETVWDPVEEVIKEQRGGYVMLIKLLLQRDPGSLIGSMDGINRASELGRTTEGKVARIEKSVKDCLEHAEMVSKKFGRLESGKSELACIGAIRMLVSLENGAITWTLEETDDRLSQIYQALNDFFFRDRAGFSYSPDDTAKGLSKMKADFKAVQEHVFLRLIAKNPTLINAAIDKSTIEEFLDDAENVKNMDLRDLALRLAAPDLMVVRNACADFASTATHGCSEKVVDASEDAKIKLCGKWIYQSSVTASLSRIGWLHLVLSTGIPLRRAYELCTTWQELRRLDFLVLQNYFAGVPNDTWNVRQVSLGVQNLRRLGFLLLWPDSMSNFYSKRTEGRPEVEYRNVLHGIMGRDDEATRRFIYMLRSFPASYYVWIRDAQTGKCLYSSLADEDSCSDAKWLIRSLNCKAKHKKEKEAEVVMDDTFITQLKRDRDWTTNKLLKDHVEIVIWDRNTASQRPLDQLILSLVSHLNKANRFRDPLVAYEQDLEVYRRCFEEEELGLDPLAAGKLEKIQELKDTISAYRQNIEPWALSEPTYYTALDAKIDQKLHPFDNDPIWGTAENFEMQINSETMHRALAELGPNASPFDLFQYFSRQQAASHIIPETSIPETTPDFEQTPNQSFWCIVHGQERYLLKWAEAVARYFVVRLAPADGRKFDERDLKDAYARKYIVRVMAGIEEDPLIEGIGLKLWQIATLRDNVARGRSYPDRRRTTPTDEIYRQWDAFKAEYGLDGNDKQVTAQLPDDFVQEILLTVTKLWKEGAISPTDILHPSFAPFAAVDKESYIGLKTYLDYRSLSTSNALALPENTAHPNLETQLTALTASLPPTARFSLLKLKSGELHFPIPLPPSKTRDRLIFADPLGRRWKWNYYPKDLPGTEQMMERRLEAAIGIEGNDGRTLKEVARVRGDTVLVWGGMVMECVKNTMRVVERVEMLGESYAVDWGRSFVGVEREVLEGLGERWWGD